MIRDAAADDIPQVAQLIAAFYDDAPYEAPQINLKKTEYVLPFFLGGKPNVFFKVIEVEGGLVGAVLAERTQDLWSDALKTMDHFIYVKPPWRGSLAAGRLIMQLRDWANEVPSVVRFEASSGLKDDELGRVFMKSGWSYRGTLYGSEAY